MPSRENDGGGFASQPKQNTAKVSQHVLCKVGTSLLDHSYPLPASASYFTHCYAFGWTPRARERMPRAGVDWGMNLATISADNKNMSFDQKNVSLQNFPTSQGLPVTQCSRRAQLCKQSVEESICHSLYHGTGRRYIQNK